MKDLMLIAMSVSMSTLGLVVGIINILQEDWLFCLYSFTSSVCWLRTIFAIVKDMSGSED